MPESPWKLLHENLPQTEKETYAGFLDRSGVLVFWEGLWRVDDWLLLSNGRDAFGYVAYPADLPVDIHWCYTSEFVSEVDARQSLRSLLSQPCDRP